MQITSDENGFCSKTKAQDAIQPCVYAEKLTELLQNLSATLDDAGGEIYYTT
jgi:hypothetical protein